MPITGAASGIGRSTALLASEAGASIAAVGINEPGLAATVETVQNAGGRVASRLADVADQAELPSAVRALAEELRPFQGVANAAVLPPPVPVEELDWQQWDRVLDVNLTGAVRTLVSVAVRGRRWMAPRDRIVAGPAAAPGETRLSRGQGRSARRRAGARLGDGRQARPGERSGAAEHLPADLGTGRASALEVALLARLRRSPPRLR
ncbi:MAG TPA: SDR family NAD(P)-dependent oxidoreductase [Nocardioidaceae bacterium]|nr:SDR family NAD(P)-dependent oxidoreductase [Nocardioidaceae bacterium]